MIQGASQLKKSNKIIITKSLKDVMVLSENSFSAIAPNSEGIVFSEERIKKITSNFNKIFLFYDNDLAGFQGSRKYNKLYPDITCIFLKRKYSKDISDFFRKNKNEAVKAIDELKNIDTLTENKQLLKYFYYF